MRSKKLCRLLSLMLILVFFAQLLPTSVFAEQGELPFTDVPEDAWYYSDVSFVYEDGLMEGVSDTNFLPMGETSRAMVVTVLFRLAGEPSDRGAGFTDVPEGQWFSDAILWAQSAGIAQGRGNGNFVPHAPMTRQEMITVFYRYALSRGLNVSAAADLGLFSDAYAVSDYATAPLSWALAAGIIRGVSETMLQPEGLSNRAQLAAVLGRFCGFIQGSLAAPVIPEYIAQLYGIDAYETDTDEDGLDNYTEIFITGTDPRLEDTDGNGISDLLEDSDGDGLDNAAELRYGSSLKDKDSDKDGLSDSEEVQTYHSDPQKADTDGDGLIDGDEILLGVDPVNAVTDGITADAERSFRQTLGDQNIDNRLLSVENAVVPSLTASMKGNINRKVRMEVTGSNRFSDSRAIVGQSFDLIGEDLQSGTLSFHLRYSDISYISHDGGASPALLICRYNSDGTTDYLPTEYSDGTLSAEIDGEGTYYVLDVKKLFDELGLELPQMGEGSPALRAPQRAMAQADIVFVIDTTSSMRNEINNVKENVGSFVNQLEAEGISASLALVDYQDIQYDGYDSTQVHKNGSSNWFSDMDAYASAIGALELGIGGDHAECAVDALETARLLDMRASAGKIFVLLTDAIYKVDNRYEIPSMEAEIQLLENAGVRCCVITPEALKDTYSDLYTRTGGTWLNIYGNFYTELMSLARTLGDEIVGDGYWIYLDSPIPVPVRLDAEPTPGSTVDTDGDGIPDIEELKDYGPTKSIDLDQLLTQVSQGIITGTNYGEIMMYEYGSSPVLTDTDYDGIEDADDAAPDNNQFSGIMYYSSGDRNCNVEFRVDYRLLFGDNTAYSSDLCVLTSLLANDMYADVHVTVTKGASGGSSNPADFPAVFGMQDVEDIHLTSKEYSVDPDDVSEFVLGHRTVTYGGESREIILLSVRGTNGTNAEWSSNFDVGADTSAYYNAVGSSHPHWKNKLNHKGFDVTANRIIDKFNDYMDRHGLNSSSLPKTILINGHSRGAAIANLLGAYFEDHDDFTSFTYTFAAPYSTTDPNASNYKTIFNITNSDDLIPALPLEAWGFKKYGKILSISVADYYNNGTTAGNFKWLTGDSYNDNGGIASALNAFSAIAANRDQLYVLDYSTDGQVNIGNKYHTTMNGAEERLAALSTELDGYKLLRFCALDIVTQLGIKHVRVTYSPAYLMQNLANIASGTGPVLGYDTKGKYADAFRAFAICYIGGMTHPHYQPTYYLIAYNDVKPLS